MRDERILLAHGGGGSMTADLVNHMFLPAFGNDVLRRLGDAALIDAEHLLTCGSRLAFTTDSYVVKPLFWPGGDLGRVAVCGTVNDLAMVGAQPLYISAGFIVEEGLPLVDLRSIVASMKSAAEEAGVAIVAGDTKVVERGAADQLFINTAGIGIVPPTVDLGPDKVKPGDVVLVSGFLGDHGLAVLSRREGVQFDVPLTSDVAPLNDLVAAIMPRGGVRVMRDPTRGGLAGTLNELASQGGFGIMIDERLLPIRPSVHAACELLGYDPLHVANEGKLVAIVDQARADPVLAALRAHRYGIDAALIGHIIEGPAHKVLLRTAVGGTRIVRMPSGELLPRIC
jgi:hydrogenase expression/formation protein HypE